MIWFSILRFTIRITIVPPFAGLQQFCEGRGFKQWTGDDSKVLMKVHLYAQNNGALMSSSIRNIFKGLPTSNWGICSHWDHADIECISWLFLHCSLQHYYQPGNRRFSWCTKVISTILQDLWNNQCLTSRPDPTSSTFPCTLCETHSWLWCPEWSMFIYYGIKAYWSHQKTLASLKSI